MSGKYINQTRNSTSTASLQVAASGAHGNAPNRNETTRATSSSDTKMHHTTSSSNTHTSHTTTSSHSTQPPHPAAVGTFTCLYESKDKKYCLFADENGHLTSVKAHRLS